MGHHTEKPKHVWNRQFIAQVIANTQRANYHEIKPHRETEMEGRVAILEQIGLLCNDNFFLPNKNHQ